MIAKLKNIFTRKQESVDYFWVGRGDNPLRAHGIKDLSEHK